MPGHLMVLGSNAPGTYPSGRHLQPLVESLSAERVRRASPGLGLLRRYLPETIVSPAGTRVAS